MWIYAGAALMLLELVAPGFILCFFGFSALTVGLLKFALGDVFTLTGQLAAFSGLSVLYIAILRRALNKVFVGDKIEAKTDFGNESVGRLGKVTAAIRPPLSGRVLIGDSEWTAVASAPIDAGADVKVVSQDNLTMTVESLLG